MNAKTILSKFIEAELNAYISEQRLTESPLMVKLLCRAFEAYDEYKRLVSIPPVFPNNGPILYANSICHHEWHHFENRCIKCGLKR